MSGSNHLEDFYFSLRTIQARDRKYTILCGIHDRFLRKFEGKTTSAFAVQSVPNSTLAILPSFFSSEAVMTRDKLNGARNASAGSNFALGRVQSKRLSLNESRLALKAARISVKYSSIIFSRYCI